MSDTQTTPSNSLPNRRHGIPMTEEEAAAIIADYQAGIGMHRIERKYDIPTSNIYILLKARGVPRREGKAFGGKKRQPGVSSYRRHHSRLPLAKKYDIVARRVRGEPVTKIAREEGISTVTVYRILTEAQIEEKYKAAASTLAEALPKAAQNVSEQVGKGSIDDSWKLLERADVRVYDRPEQKGGGTTVNVAVFSPENAAKILDALMPKQLDEPNNQS